MDFQVLDNYTLEMFLSLAFAVVKLAEVKILVLL